MRDLQELVHTVIDAYNAGDPEPLIALMAPDVAYEIVHLGQAYRGIEQVAALAREGAGRTFFHLKEIARSGQLVSYTYDHENALPGQEYSGPGLAVQEYDGTGRLTHQWAFRSLHPEGTR